MIATHAPPAHIIIILTDQQRSDTIHALDGWCGATPAFDRLVREGRAFTQATTPCPVCMAARASLYSGLYPRQHGTRSNHHRGRHIADHLFARMRAAGYRTALIGKNHSFITPQDVDVFDPHPSPSDLVAAAERAAWSRAALAREPRLPTGVAPGGPAGDRERGVTEAAIRLLAQAREPWAIVVSYESPHTPYIACEPFTSQPCDPPPPAVEPDGLVGKPWRQRFHQANETAMLGDQMARWPQLRCTYAARVRQIDAEIGLVLEAIDRTGTAHDTLVIATSDHGDYLGDHGLFAKSPALYDCLVRVPLLLHWPGRIPAGSCAAGPASLIDILPTCCAAAGAPAGDGLPGQDLCAPDRRSWAYAEYGVPGQPWSGDLDAPGLQRNPVAGLSALPWEGNPIALAGEIRMVRSDRWKVIHEPSGTDEVYDLAADPHELRNLAGSGVRPELGPAAAAWLAGQAWSSGGGDQRLGTTP